MWGIPISWGRTDGRTDGVGRFVCLLLCSVNTHGMVSAPKHQRFLGAGILVVGMLQPPRYAAVPPHYSIL